MPSSMDRPHWYAVSAAVAALAVGFTVGAAAAERVEHVQTQTESSATYDEALRAAEQQYGRDSEQVLAPLMALGHSRRRSCFALSAEVRRRKAGRDDRNHLSRGLPDG